MTAGASAPSIRHPGVAWFGQQSMWGPSMCHLVLARASLLLVAVLVLAGCSSAPSRTLPEITFADQSPIALDVERIEIVQRYEPAFADPYVDHLFPRPPATVIRRWAEERLLARGATGTATLIIQDASVTEEVLARNPGLQGLVTIEQSERYEARIAVRLEVTKPTSSGYAEVLAQRSITAPENASLADREQIWFELTENVIDDLDAKFEQEVAQGLSRYIVR